MSRVVSLCLGVFFLGSVALSGCVVDEGESDPDVLELEEVDDVDLALDDGNLGSPLEGELRGVGATQPDGEHEPADGESTDGPPGTEEAEPDPHPWFVPADADVDDKGHAAGTPI